MYLKLTFFKSTDQNTASLKFFHYKNNIQYDLKETLQKFYFKSISLLQCTVLIMIVTAIDRGPSLSTIT